MARHDTILMVSGIPHGLARSAALHFEEQIMWPVKTWLVPGGAAIGEVLGDIAMERAKQDAKWGEQNHRDIPRTAAGKIRESADRSRVACEKAARAGTLSWAHILDEEFCEAMAEAAEGNEDKLRAELIQVAAVATAWVECIDRRKRQREIDKADERKIREDSARRAHRSVGEGARQAFAEADANPGRTHPRMGSGSSLLSLPGGVC